MFVKKETTINQTKNIKMAYSLKEFPMCPQYLAQILSLN